MFDSRRAEQRGQDKPSDGFRVFSWAEWWNHLGDLSVLSGMREKLVVAAASMLAMLLLLPAPGRAGVPERTQTSEEKPVSDFIDVPAEGHQVAPEITYGSDGNALAAWADERLETPRIFVSVLTDGATSKVTGFDLSRSTQLTRQPAVASSKGRYLVVWVEAPNEVEEVHGAVLDLKGNVVVPDRKLMTTAPDAFYIGPGIASDGNLAAAGGGNGFMVSALDAKGNLTALPVSLDGRPGAPREVYDEGRVGHPSLAFGGGVFLLSFMTCGEEDCRFGARAARLSPAGDVLDPDGLPLARPSADFLRISAAWDGARYLVVWTQNGQIMGSYVTPDQRPGSAEPFLVAASQGAHAPDIVWTGTSFVVAWVQGGTTQTLMTAAVQDMVEAPSAAQTPISERATFETKPVLASTGSRTTLLWDAPGGDFRDVLGAELLPMGAPSGDGGTVVQSANGQIHPSLTAGAGYLALWQDYRAHKGPEIYGGRVGPNSELLDPQGFRISPQNGRHPVAAWNGQDWLVVWMQEVRGYQALMGSRISPDGRVQDPASIPIYIGGGRKSHVRVESNGDSFVVIWHERETRSVHTVHVSSQGMSSRSPIQIDRNSYTPSIAWHGDRYVAVWSRDGDIKGAYLDDRGEAIDAARRVTTNDSLDFEPSVASNGDQAFITWSRCRNSYENCPTRDIFGVMSLNSLDVPPPTELSNDARKDDEPISIWDGTGFGVAWKSCAVPEVCDRPAAYLRWVDGAGAPVGTAAEVARAHIRGAPSFTATSLGDGTLALTYRRIDGPPGVTGVPRGYLRTARRL